MSEPKVIWSGTYAGIPADVRVVNSEPFVFFSGHMRVFVNDIEGILGAAVMGLAAERDELHARLSKLETVNAETESNLEVWKTQYALCQSQLHLANDELKKQMYMAGVDDEGIDGVVQRLQETSRAMGKCYAFGMMRDRLGMPLVTSPAEAIDGLADRLSKLEAAARFAYDAIIESSVCDEPCSCIDCQMLEKLGEALGIPRIGEA